MIARLHGIVYKGIPGKAVVDVQGVGYAVSTPLDVWDALREGGTHTLWISTYVREDRLDLFAFAENKERALFEELITKQGIGPKMALELCGVPRSILTQAVQTQDPKILKGIKGIGAKTAEKLLLELRELQEKHPEMFMVQSGGSVRSSMDQDAVAALSSLGYDMPTIMHALKELPADLGTTEARVAAALRSL